MTVQTKSGYPMTDELVEKVARAIALVVAERHQHSLEDWLSDARRDEARAAIEASGLASLEERERVRSWQPIETAPKQECVILAWDGFHVFEAYWYGDHAVTNQSLKTRPWVSHWMPLPEPPALSAGVRQND